ncbi:MAG: pyrroline-5-carboxylate reductase [Leptolyngbyaceae cyanobacterium SM2_5_2]|nr:pyrroline-5-carboxylate reductase [Leptolyngbyaceae cyanobacterium SM2_5_2]
MPEATLGVIGGGVMGEALISRLLDQGIFAPPAIWVSDPQAARRDFLQQSYGVQTTTNNAAVVERAQAVLLAVKPQVLSTVAQELSTSLPPGISPPLGLSILAGVPLARLAQYFPGWAMVRAMPNTPATVGAGITALAAGDRVTPAQLQQARTIFASVGEVIEVPENLMDAVTALSGSGPGYVALMVEALADGGVAVGLSRATAMQLALQTLKGTAELLQQSALHPGELKDRVTSPGGTTMAGIAQLEAAGLRSALIEAVRAAHRRARELGQL